MALLAVYANTPPDVFAAMDHAESKAFARKVVKLVQTSREEAWKRTELIVKACGGRIR